MELVSDQLLPHIALSFLLTHKVEADAGTVYCISARTRHQFKLQFEVSRYKNTRLPLKQTEMIKVSDLRKA